MSMAFFSLRIAHSLCCNGENRKEGETTFISTFANIPGPRCLPSPTATRALSALGSHSDLIPPDFNAVE